MSGQAVAAMIKGEAMIKGIVFRAMRATVPSAGRGQRPRGNGGVGVGFT